MCVCVCEGGNLSNQLFWWVYSRCWSLAYVAIKIQGTPGGVEHGCIRWVLYPFTLQICVREGVGMGEVRKVLPNCWLKTNEKQSKF